MTSPTAADKAVAARPLLDEAAHYERIAAAASDMAFRADTVEAASALHRYAASAEAHAAALREAAADNYIPSTDTIIVERTRNAAEAARDAVELVAAIEVRPAP